VVNDFQVESDSRKLGVSLDRILETSLFLTSCCLEELEDLGEEDMVLLGPHFGFFSLMMGFNQKRSPVFTSKLVPIAMPSSSRSSSLDRDQDRD